MNIVNLLLVGGTAAVVSAGVFGLSAWPARLGWVESHSVAWKPSFPPPPGQMPDPEGLEKPDAGAVEKELEQATKEAERLRTEANAARLAFVASLTAVATGRSVSTLPELADATTFTNWWRSEKSRLDEDLKKSQPIPLEFAIPWGKGDAPMPDASTFKPAPGQDFYLDAPSNAGLPSERAGKLHFIWVPPAEAVGKGFWMSKDEISSPPPAELLFVVDGRTTVAGIPLPGPFECRMPKVEEWLRALEAKESEIPNLDAGLGERVMQDGKEVIIGKAGTPGLQALTDASWRAVRSQEERVAATRNTEPEPTSGQVRSRAKELCAAAGRPLFAAPEFDGRARTDLMTKRRTFQETNFSHRWIIEPR